MEYLKETVDTKNYDCRLAKQEEIFTEDKIQFLYKGKQIKIYNNFLFYSNEYQRPTLEEYFKNDKMPKIFVKNANDLLLINWYKSKNITFITNHG